MNTVVEACEFIELSKSINVVDVRSPSEFIRGHAPNALNIPLFDDDERKKVGIVYHQKGRDSAVLEGIKIISLKLITIVEQTLAMISGGFLLVYCWRGGMRSESVAFLLNQMGIKTYTLKGGYKSYRNYILKSFSKKLSLLVIGGNTGSKKTAILNNIKKLGEQVIDLENIASHKGSAFGNLGMLPQPSQEQFENNLATQLFEVKDSSLLWLEDESRNIGKVILPLGLWNQMLHAPLIVLTIPLTVRVDFLKNEYGKQELSSHILTIKKIEKRLGYERALKAIEALNQGNIAGAIKIVLSYYDKSYIQSQSNRLPNTITHLSFNHGNIEIIMKRLLSISTKIILN